MRRRGPLSLVLLLLPAVSAPGQEPRPICDPWGLRECVPDHLEILFAFSGLPLDDASEHNAVLRDPELGSLVEARIVLEALTEGIRGWSYAVRHDPEHLEIDPVSVGVEGTRFHRRHPESLVVPPHVEVTRAVKSPGAGEDDPFTGFTSAIILAIVQNRTLPVGRHVVAVASYRVLAREDTTLAFSDGEIGSPATRIVLTVDDRATLPSFVIDGQVLFREVAEDDCLNGLDDDEDGLVDCDDSDCHNSDECNEPFLRGDADGNGRVNVADAVLTMRAAAGIAVPRFDCVDAFDSDDDGRAVISDAVFLLRWLFQSGEPVSPPFVQCGLDPTPDEIRCREAPAACEGQERRPLR